MSQWITDSGAALSIRDSTSPIVQNSWQNGVYLNNPNQEHEEETEEAQQQGVVTRSKHKEEVKGSWMTSTA